MNQLKSFCFLASLALLGCHSSKKLQSSLPLQIENSFVFKKSFTGFALYDPVEDEMLYEYQSDKYFTPASNTKLFTFYTCLKVLDDFLPALEYVVTGDSLLFWGTGDPSFLHPYLEYDPLAFNFLQNRKERLFYCSANFQDTRFGPGWAWDDYLYYFQPERSPFPIYGNTILLQKDSFQTGFQVKPAIFNNYVNFDPTLGGERPRFLRGENDNNFRFNAQAVTGSGYAKEMPFKYADEFLIELLRDTLQRPVRLLNLNILPSAFEDSETLYGTNLMELYRAMMQQSDNFIAEQLLLTCSHRLFNTLNVRMAIDYAKDSLLQDLPDEPIWVDGSGLSRYNLFTPRTIVKLLQKIQLRLSEEELFAIFPAGGTSGTIENWYHGIDGTPYVFAKTGTLSNKHCLSGYLKTKKGKMLIFSFMHNNYIGSSVPLKKEMQKILAHIRTEY